MNILISIINFYLKNVYIITNGIIVTCDWLDKLDCDMRSNVYIGVTGLLTAIVILVAELMASNEKSKVDRNVFLRKTNISTNVTVMIINLIGLLISEITIGAFNYIFQLILNISIFTSMFKTLQMFKDLIDLSLSENELAIERDRYVKEKLENYDIKIRKLKQTEELSEKRIEKYFENNKLISYEKYPYRLENYKAIEAKMEGVLKELDINKLKSIIEKRIKNVDKKEILKVELNENIKNKFKDITQKDNKPEEQNILMITALEGQHIYYKTPLFFIKKEYIEFVDDILMCFKVIKDDKHINEDASTIIDEIVNKIRNTKYYNTIHYDIVDFFEDIVNNNWKNVEELFYSKIYILAKEFIQTQDYEKIYILYKTMEDIVFKLIKNNKLNACEKYYNISFLLLLNIFDKPNVEIEDYSFEFITFVNSCIYRCENKGEFLDLLLSKVLSLIKRLLRLKNIDAIYVVLNNLAITTEHRLHTEEDKIDVLMQFVLGIIYAAMYEEESLREIQFHDLKKIINLLISKFRFDYQYTTFEIIIKLKELSGKVTKIYGIFDNFAFGEPEDHRNMSSWNGNSLDMNDAIIGFLNLYSVNGDSTINERKVDKYDQYFCDNFLSCLEKNKYKDFFENFQDKMKINVGLINRVLYEVKNISRKKELLYIIKTPLNVDKIKEFKDIIFEGINSNSKILKLFTKNNIKHSNEISVKNINIRDYINREMFFDDTNWGKIYAEEVVELINAKITEQIIKKITFKSNNISSVEEAIDKIENKEEIIIISGVKDSWIKFKNNEVYEYNKLKIPIIKELSEKTLVLTRSALPVLKYMKVNKENMLKGEFRNNAYLVLLDLADNEYVKNRIIEECEEGDDIEGIKEYLQTRCAFQIFVPLQIIDGTNEDVYVIDE